MFIPILSGLLLIAVIIKHYVVYFTKVYRINGHLVVGALEIIFIFLASIYYFPTDASLFLLVVYAPLLIDFFASVYFEWTEIWGNKYK
ncbi:MAG: hypothetical protein K9L74_03850 [Candidatus Izimaplasma sp.]|nr:hypothetical protein [Candidatus Izimaplasma bacterium]